MNHSKSSLTPSQSLDYLGMTLQMHPSRAFPTQPRIRKVLSLVAEFVSSRQQPLSAWRSLLGVMSSMSSLVPGARLRMRSLQLRLNVAGTLAVENTLVSLDDSCLQDLRWWSVVAHLDIGIPLDLPHPDLLLFTDASDVWGASLGGRPSVRLMVSRLFDVFHQPSRTYGDPSSCLWFSPSSRQSICGTVFRQHHRSVLPSEGG